MPALPCDALLQRAQGSRKTVTRNLPPAMLLIKNPGLKWAARIRVSRLLKGWECRCLTFSSCCGRQLGRVLWWALQIFCCTQALGNLHLWHHICVGCDIIEHSKMRHCCIPKVAYLPWQAVSAPCVHVPKPWRSAARWPPQLVAGCAHAQQHTAVHSSWQRLSPNAGQKVGKKLRGYRGKVTTNIRNSSLSFIELLWRKHLLCRTNSSPKIIIKVIA